MSEGMERRLQSLAILAILALVAINLATSYRGFGTVAPVQQNSENKTIRVSGTGTVSVTPNRVWLFLAVLTQAPSATQALQQNSESMSSLIQALVNAGVPKTDIETIGFSVTPIVDYRDRLPPQIVGYAVRNSIKVTLSDLTAVGRIIDLSVSSGANEVQNIYFTLSKEKTKELRDEVLRLAVQDAADKASSVAKDMGLTLLGPISVNVGYSYEPYRVAVMKPSAPETPILPGEVQFSASVDVVYAFG